MLLLTFRPFSIFLIAVCFNILAILTAGLSHSQGSPENESDYYEILWESPVVLSNYADEYLGVFDFNSDGLDDVLLGGNHPDTEIKTPVFLLISNGDGTLTERTSEFISGEIALALPRSTVGDYNSDGFLDIAAFDFGNGKLPGSGTFEPEVPYLLLSNAEGKWEVSDIIEKAEQLVNPFVDLGKIHVKSATSGDVDNDGALDIYVESGGGTNTINPHFIINQGSGEFIVDNSERRISSGYFCNPGACWRYATHRLYDLNNDGFLDLVMGQLRRRNNNQQELYNRVVWNDGNGRFKRSASYYEYSDDGGIDVSVTGQEIAIVFDLDQDGKDEIVVGGSLPESTIRIFSGQDDGSLEDKTEDILAEPVTISKPVGEVGDFDSDGDKDLVLFPKNGGFPALLMNDNGVFNLNVSLIDALVAGQNGSDLSMQVEYITSGDIDLDGDIDLFVLSSGKDGDLPPHFLINESGTGFTVDYDEERIPVDIVFGPNQSWLFGAPILHDVNNDGYLDLILGQFRSFFSFQDELASYVLFNDGSGRFRENSAMPLPYPEWNEGRTNVKASTSCDLNDDELSDLVFVHDRGFDQDGGNNNSGIFFQVLINQNGETFFDQTAVYFPDQTNTSGYMYNNAPYKVYCTDINEDGLTDLATGGSRAFIGTHNPVFFLRQIDDSFQAFDSSLLTNGRTNTGQYAYPVRLNEEQKVDIISIDPYQNTVSSLLVSWIQKAKIGSELADTFIDFPHVEWHEGFTAVKSMTSWDSNEDGYLDLILGHEKGPEDRTGNTGYSLQFLTNQKGMSFIDETHLFIGDQSKTRISETQTYGLNYNTPRDLLLIDMNMDGYKDIVMGVTNMPLSEYSPFIYLNNGSNFFTPIDTDLITGGNIWFGRRAYPLDLNGDELMDFITVDLLPGPDGIYNTGDEHSQVISVLGKNPIEITDQTGTQLELELPKEADEIILHQNYPNPFFQMTSIRYSSNDITEGLIVIYDILGRAVKKWELKGYSGETKIYWDGTNNEGQPLPSGTYFYRLEIKDQVITKALTIIR